MSKRKNHLPIGIKKFGFVEREKENDCYVHNKCGRDFLYYCLHYYYPRKYNQKRNNPATIEKRELFGLSLPSWLAWTMFQFLRVPAFLKTECLSLEINNKKIASFFSFIIAILTPQRKSVKQAIKEVEKVVDAGYAVGIDITLSMVFLNHVMFVYGYNKENLYVFDTHKTPLLDYKKLTTDNRYIMKLPKSLIAKHWTHFGRVWIVKPEKS